MTLFDPPAVAPLRAPRSPKAASGEAKWTTYNPKVVRKCEDCLQVTYESMRRGESAPLARSARFKLTQEGKIVVLVCAEHKNLRTDPGA